MAIHFPERFRDAETALHEAATDFCGGLSDFGADTYRAGLRVLLEAMDSEARVLPERRAFAYREVMMTLAARLFAEAGWKANPATKTLAIRKPIIITGLPRSCTTALQFLLSNDPQFQFLPNWLTNVPQPRPVGDKWRESAAYRRTVARFDDWFDSVPEFRRIHEMGPDNAEECIELLKQEFVTYRFGANFNVPSYDAWWVKHSQDNAYRRWADMLRLIAINEPERCWLLKNPGHTQEMDRLLETFPDARVIYTHRDPLEVIPSVASLIHMARQICAGDNADPAQVGPRENWLWGRATERMLASIDRQPMNKLDVMHREFTSDPMGVVRKIYRTFNLELRADVEAAMQQWVRNNPKGKHGAHAYDLAQFGLSEDAVRESFADYIDRYRGF